MSDYHDISQFCYCVDSHVVDPEFGVDLPVDHLTARQVDREDGWTDEEYQDHLDEVYKDFYPRLGVFFDN